jgi:hypothetical protein
MEPKVENAVEKSDVFHDALMKPVTYSNHKQMEKTVDAAIAHAKRVGDDDLLELAEEVGHEILALRSRASRSGEKARFSLSPEDARHLKEILSYDDVFDFAIVGNELQVAKSEMRAAKHALDYWNRLRKDDGDPEVPLKITELKRAGRWMDSARGKVQITPEELRRQKSLAEKVLAKSKQALKDALRSGNTHLANSVIEEERMAKGIISWVNAGGRGEPKSADTGRPIPFLFSRPGAKAEMGNGQKYYTGPGKRDPRRLIGVYDAKGKWLKDMATEREARAFVEKQMSSRPGAKAKMGKITPAQVDKVIGRVKADLLGLERAASRRSTADIQHYAMQAISALSILEEGEFARPGEKKKFGLERELSLDLDEAGIDHDWESGFIYVKSERDAKAAKDVIRRGDVVSDQSKAKVAAKVKVRAVNSRPSEKAKMGLDDACWEGYEAVGTKKKDGKDVPNCVPKATAAKPEVEETEEQKAGLKIMSAADPKVGDKVRTLMKEGKPQDQAVAIALDMKRRGEL